MKFWTVYHMVSQDFFITIIANKFLKSSSCPKTVLWEELPQIMHAHYVVAKYYLLFRKTWIIFLINKIVLRFLFVLEKCHFRIPRNTDTEYFRVSCQERQEFYHIFYCIIFCWNFAQRPWMQMLHLCLNGFLYFCNSFFAHHYAQISQYTV